MADLSLHSLRAANQDRLPKFKNHLGEPAHSKPDGSDWTPAQWLQALIGEVGELCDARLAYDMAVVKPDEYQANVGKELADVQTYLDLVARRALDSVPQLTDPEQADAAQRLLVVMSNLGAYANLRKKMDRGDCSVEEFSDVAPSMLNAAIFAIRQLMVVGPSNATLHAHPTGIDLAEATARKFNEVSRRVGADTRIRTDGDNYRAWAPYAKKTILWATEINKLFIVTGFARRINEEGESFCYLGVTQDGLLSEIPEAHLRLAFIGGEELSMMLQLGGFDR